MPDRIIRDELLESDRWLDLPTDSARLAFVGLLLIADDFGNLEGGPRRMYRFLHSITQIKSENAAQEILLSLIDCDLLRRYEVDGRELFHIPRFRPHRQYLVRKMPASPWDDNRQLGKIKRIEIRGLAKDQQVTKNLPTTSLPLACDIAEGVDVGVGVGVGKNLIKPNGFMSGKTPDAHQKWHKEAKELLDFLNAKAGRCYRPGKANIEMIVARLKEGATPQECRQVIAKKCREWIGDPKMAEYLRPATLFNRTKFAQYQGELNVERMPGLPIAG